MIQDILLLIEIARASRTNPTFRRYYRIARGNGARRKHAAKFALHWCGVRVAS